MIIFPVRFDDGFYKFCIGKIGNNVTHISLLALLTELSTTPSRHSIILPNRNALAGQARRDARSHHHNQAEASLPVLVPPLGFFSCSLSLSLPIHLWQAHPAYGRWCRCKE